jgi:membrane fusion protein, multidrug efflux system
VRHFTKLFFILAAILVVAAAGWWVASQKGGTASAAQPRGATGPRSQQQAVPILAAAAEAKDMPIIVRGIGSVQAFNTVTVKSRVDGNIVEVAFVEGQYVKSGDPADADRPAAL